MIKILFVCHGNICRSPMAEFVFQDMVNKAHLEQHFQIDSAATSREEIGNPVHTGTLRKLAAERVPVKDHRARQVTWQDYQEYDYLIGMDSQNIRNMLRLLKNDPNEKICRLLDFTKNPRDIADPWYTGNFDATYRDVREGCEALLEKLRKSFSADH
ncbi:low molecular weight protein-tyrosine-phosphatase [Hominifimenecus sp. rT4P-3]|uniref:low molecular weight protein-tyrosine-phosphatase n=1 Tax=Hominifimenecus sp. rT4P-3 TaxID=3242979 RepID=UPI003DA2C566